MHSHSTSSHALSQHTLTRTLTTHAHTHPNSYRPSELCCSCARSWLSQSPPRPPRPPRTTRHCRARCCYSGSCLGDCAYCSPTQHVCVCHCVCRCVCRPACLPSGLIYLFGYICYWLYCLTWSSNRHPPWCLLRSETHTKIQNTHTNKRILVFCTFR